MNKGHPTDPDPDGPLDTTYGTALPAGQSIELEQPPIIRARLRMSGFTPGTDDSASWSALLDVEPSAN